MSLQRPFLASYLHCNPHLPYGTGKLHQLRLSGFTHSCWRPLITGWTRCLFPYLICLLIIVYRSLLYTVFAVLWNLLHASQSAPTLPFLVIPIIFFVFVDENDISTDIGLSLILTGLSCEASCNIFPCEHLCWLRLRGIIYASGIDAEQQTILPWSIETMLLFTVSIKSPGDWYQFPMLLPDLFVTIHRPVNQSGLCPSSIQPAPS